MRSMLIENYVSAKKRIGIDQGWSGSAINIANVVKCTFDGQHGLHPNVVGSPMIKRNVLGD